jgi:hypothetical protein
MHFTIRKYRTTRKYNEDFYNIFLTRRLKIWHFSYKRTILPIFSKNRETFAKLNKKKKLLFFRRKNIIFSLKAKKIYRMFSLPQQNFINSRKLTYYYQKFKKFFSKVSKKNQGYIKINKLIFNKRFKINNTFVKTFLIKNLKRNFHYKLNLYKNYIKIIKLFIKSICSFYDSQLDYLTVFLQMPQQNIDHKILTTTAFIKYLDKQETGVTLKGFKNDRLETFILEERLGRGLTKEEFYEAAFFGAEDLFTKDRKPTHFNLQILRKLLNKTYIKLNYTFNGQLLSRYRASWNLKKKPRYKLKKVFNLKNLKNINYYVKHHQIFLDKIKYLNKNLWNEYIEQYLFELELIKFLKKKKIIILNVVY